MIIIKVIVDALLINLSFILAYYLRFKILFFITPDSVPIFADYSNILLFITVVWLAVFQLIGLYEKRKYVSLIDELANLFIGVSLSTLILLGLLFLNQEFWLSRLVIANAWWLALLFMALWRILMFSLRRYGRLRGFGLRNTLIIGTGEMGKMLAQKIVADKSLGYKLVGLVVADLEKIKQEVVTNNVSEILIAGDKLSTEKMLEIITECERFGVEFKIVPGILELIASRIDVDELAGVPLLTVAEIRLKGWRAAAKRCTDVVLSLGIITLISPLLLLFALLIKLTSAGPISFVQKRVGLDGKEFSMFKFRSMVKDAEAILPELESQSEASGHIFKIKDDPRMTKLGKFMRRYSIDELPQLFNVLFGQMSLVGPRPPLPREVEKYNSWHKKRLRVRPGITGPWQVSGRSLLPFDDMVRLDIYYIENWSLWLDLKILLRTIPVVITASGAY